MQLFIDCHSISDIHNATGRERALCRGVSKSRDISHPSMHLVADKKAGRSPPTAQKVVLEGGSNICHRGQAPELTGPGPSALSPAAGEVEAVKYVGD